MSIIITRRHTNIQSHGLSQDLHPILKKIYQHRGITASSEIQYELKNLLPFAELRNIDAAVALLVTALQDRQHIMIIGDFDADGATSTALAVRALRSMGAFKVSFLVPNRFDFGYGLTPEIVAVAAKQHPDLIITVDNGISSVAGVAAAQQQGIKVLITDHHLPGNELPAAAAIVDPNQHGDYFNSKHLAGVGVCFYVMLALRSKLRELQWFSQQALTEPNMAELLDIVALGTVADVVPLDANNRTLVYQGLQRIRAGKCIAGIKALLEVSKRVPTRITAADLGFALGPRLNAAGRLEDMRLGIKCLLTDDLEQARNYAQQLELLNRQRRSIESEMRQQALNVLQKLTFNSKKLPSGLCVFDQQWHQGVIGILASRLKDQYHRPVIAFAGVGNGELKGSARSIRHLHIRDVLDAIAKRHPQLISKFGGHAMAAGLSIKLEHYDAFATAFNTEVEQHLQAEDLQGEILSDGELTDADLSLTLAEILERAGPWGQAFPEPLFDNEFEIIEQRIVAEKHLRLMLKPSMGDKLLTAIKFNINLAAWPNHRCQQVHAVYKLAVNEFNGLKSVQLLIEHLSPLAS